MDAKIDCAAVVSLLKAMSDAVVKLDENLKIEEHSPQFAGLLMNGSKTLAGAAFEQFLASDSDRVRFSERMREIHAAQTIADVLYLTLHDSMRNPVRVELFHVSFVKLGSRLRHFLGVREQGDVEQRGSQALEANVCGQDLVASLPDDTTLRQSDTALFHEAREQPPQPIRFTFDPVSMDIETCSESFLRLLGVSDINDVAGMPLMTWFPESSNASFMDGYADMLRKFQSEDLPKISKKFHIYMRQEQCGSSSLAKRTQGEFAMKVTISNLSPAGASAVLQGWRSLGPQRRKVVGSSMSNRKRGTCSSKCSSSGSSSLSSRSNNSIGSSRSSRSSHCSRKRMHVPRYDIGTNEPVQDNRRVSLHEL